MRTKSYLSGYTGEVIRNILESGFMARDVIRLYEGPYAEQMRRTISRLKKDGVIEESKTIAGTKYLTLTKAGEEKVFCEANAELIKTYTSPRAKQSVRYLAMQKPKRVSKEKNNVVAYKTVQNKTINDATAKVFMKLAGVNLGTEADIENGEIKKNATLYLDSAATKKLGSYKATMTMQFGTQKLSNSRINGIGITGGGIYGVYFTGNATPEWRRDGEKRMVACIKAIASRNIEGYSISIYEEECIVITKKDSNFPRMIQGEYKENSTRRTLMNIDSTYKHMYSIQYSSDGIRMFRIMQIENWQAKIKRQMFPEKEIEESSFVSTSCDGYDRHNGIYKLAFCIPDMTKLKSFAKRAAIDDEREKYHIYCYNCQLPIIAPVVKQHAKVFIISLDEMEKELGIE